MKRYLPVFLLALSVTVGCDKDFLVEEPVLAQSDVLTMSSYKNLNLSVAGAYSGLLSTAWYGQDFIIRVEMATSNGKKYLGSNFDTGRLTDAYNINYTAGNSSGPWAVAYYTISQVNRIMENLEGKGDQQDLDNLKAECLFLRAISHFDLARVYARPYNFTADASHPGVPVMLAYEDPGAPSYPERKSVKEVYESVIADLTEAEQLMSPDYERAGVADPKSTVTLPVIQALLSRVYLYSEQWQKAADYATKVIDCGRYQLWEADDFKDAACFRQDVPEGGEIIFEVYDRMNNSDNPYHDGLFSMTNPKHYSDGGASLDIINFYEDGDVRKGLFVTEQSSKGEDCYWTTKYAGKGLGDVDNNNTIVLRLSEMYLTRAEAVLHGATGGDVVADLKAIASRRHATTESASLQGVYDERRKEFAWEGHLWYDLARTKRSMTRDDYVGDAKGKTLEPSDFRWVQAIPVRELDQNKNLVQNDGYQSK